MRIDDSSIRVNRHTCIACGICVNRCIMDNLRLSVAPCTQVCPVGINCQGYVRLIAMGKEEQALEQLLPLGPFMPLIADNCTAPCEKACSRRKHDGAVHILELHRYMVEKYKEKLLKIQVPAVKFPKSVAVVGGDVSGLACGFKAILCGYSVTMYIQQSSRNDFDDFSKDIVSSLETAGAILNYDTVLEEGSLVLQLFDAIILSQSEYQSMFQTDFKGNSFPHLITDNIFCCSNTDSSEKKEVLFEIARAVETVESVNRYLNGEPLDWGRGFYTQGGAVKAYKVDQRVGSDEQRALQEDLVCGFNSETAKKQASRCFGCGRAFEKNQTCWYCLPCELECPQGALTVEIPYLVK